MGDSGKCSVCRLPFNDSYRLPLSASCGDTTCSHCLRHHTLTSHPDLTPGKEGTVPQGKDIQCQQCQKSINTDHLVINRSILAKVPLSLDDLIITEETTPNDPEAKDDNTRQYHDSASSTTFKRPSPTLPDPENDPELRTTHKAMSHDPSQVPTGWTLPPDLPQSPQDTPQHPNTEPGVIGWTAHPSHPHHNPQPTSSHPQVPLPHSPHHTKPHSHTHGHSAIPPVVAGGLGVLAGGAGVAMVSHVKKKKKKKGKEKKKKKEKRRHRSSSRSSHSSRSSSSSRSGSGSSSSSSSSS